MHHTHPRHVTTLPLFLRVCPLPLCSLTQTPISPPSYTPPMQVLVFSGSTHLLDMVAAYLQREVRGRGGGGGEKVANTSPK